MTICEYRESCIENSVQAGKNAEAGLSFYKYMTKIAHIWTNAACLGYAIDAMERTGHTPEEIQKVVDTMKMSFTDWTIDEAEQFFRQKSY